MNNVIRFKFATDPLYKMQFGPTAGCRLVPLTQDLLRLAVAGQQDQVIVEGFSRPEVVRAVLLPLINFAVMDGGELCVAYGVIPQQVGRMQGWMLKTPLARPRHLAYATRQAREHFDRWQRDDPQTFRRIELHIRADQPWRESFAKRLGMTEALGPMRRWDTLGRDYWLYARISDV